MMELTWATGRIAFAIMTFSVAGMTASAQERKITEKEVPAAVIKAFITTYPTATIKGFAREKENGKIFYEIESRDGETGRDVLYNPDGSVAEIEETIAASDLPAVVQATIRSKYPGAVVMKAEKTIQGEKIGYEVIVKQGKRRISLEFDADGALHNRAH